MEASEIAGDKLAYSCPWQLAELAPAPELTIFSATGQMTFASSADYKFDLAVTLGRLELALELAAESDSESKWRQLGEMAMQAGRLEVGIE